MCARLPAVLALVFAFLLAACQADAPPLEGAAITGQFDLVGSDGQEVTQADFAGKYLVVYFGYTYCPDVCPFDVQRMMRGFDQFAEAHPDLADDVQPLFISVDPERDTPAKVGEYVNAFSDRLVGLTGTPEQIEAAAENFSVYYSAEEHEAGNTTYAVDHSSAAYLIGREGEPIALIPVDESPEAVAAELEKWVE